jgi:hypothetical protein
LLITALCFVNKYTKIKMLRIQAVLRKVQLCDEQLACGEHAEIP